MKDMYFPDLNEIYQKVAAKMHQDRENKVDESLQENRSSPVAQFLVFIIHLSIYGYSKERFVWSLISVVGIFCLGSGPTIVHRVHNLWTSQVTCRGHHPCCRDWRSSRQPLQSPSLQRSVALVVFRIEWFGCILY
ncbi:hypothetical protein POM88_043582 [Heracleum sosnowskyi]|uniref:Uncharacterized protein n=1 Tax=Heracleum sosnowskyi TaxID=360622 RepID=A0AAD8H2P1_9APIA|nr:hypothetical protein POM88_043582 [Heracleum sosnowskyi]